MDSQHLWGGVGGRKQTCGLYFHSIIRERENKQANKKKNLPGCNFMQPGGLEIGQFSPRSGENKIGSHFLGMTQNYFPLPVSFCADRKTVGTGYLGTGCFFCVCL